MKTAVDRVDAARSDSQYALSRNGPTTTSLCPCFVIRAAGWEKGQVEKNVQDARPRFGNRSALPGLGRVEPLAGTALPGLVAADTAREPARVDR